MREHRFYINELLEDKPTLTLTDEELIHQIHRVLRLKIGDSATFFDKQGQVFFGKVKEILKKKSIFSKEKFKKNSSYIHSLATIFCGSILKKDKYEWVIQKGTELGVNRFTPIISGRTEKINLNLNRLFDIAKEAVEQSGRYVLPQIDEPIELEKQLKYCRENKIKILIAEQGSETIKKIENEFKKPHAIFIGPEGGWTEKDKDLFKENGAVFFSIGESTLRAETAMIATISYLSIIN
jgi:16S rRNA (uracil1498-N3)-methyltransferase